MCKRSVCECGFPYSWAEKEPYLRAEKQCKMADMIKPKKYDGKMPDDIEGFFNEKTRVTETENEVSRRPELLSWVTATTTTTSIRTP